MRHLSLKQFLVITFISLPCSLVFAGPIIDGKEWRQLTETVALSYNDVNSVCDIISGDCIGTVSGIDFNGWTWASIEDVSQLFDVIVDGWPGGITLLEQADSPWAPAIIDSDGALGVDPGLFQATEIDTVLEFTQLGGITRSKLDLTSSSAALVTDRIPSGELDIARTDIGVTLSFSDATVGHWLFRSTQNIPEPTSLALLSLGLAGLGFQRRRLSQQR